MRVVRVLPELDFGGVESRVEVQARLHDRRAYELVVCGFHKPGKTAATLRELGIRVDVLGVSPSPRNPRATLALARYLGRLRPDVVHASIAEANLHSLLAAGPLAVPVRIAEETGMPKHSRVARWVYRGAYRFASTVVGVTEAVCEYVRTVDRAPSDRVRLIYNCAGARYFPEVRRPADRDGSGKLSVLLVGRLVPVKQHAFFLDVLRDVLPKHPNVEVLLAGDGPLRAELAATIERHGLSSQVRLLGLRSDVPDLLSKAHVFALPSESEGCSVSLIEAMASGTRVIGSDVPGIREVMGPLAGDWTAPPGDPVRWVALLERTFQMSAQARAEVAIQGQQRAYERFSPSVYVATLESLYRELIAQRRLDRRAQV